MFRSLAALAAVALLSCAPALAQDVRTLPAAQPLAGTEKLPAVQGAGCPTKTTPCATVAVTPAQVATFLAPTFQAKDADLDAISALATTSTGRDLLTSADAAAIRGKAGLGSIATQAASGVAITGGTIVGITDLALADGGTGASTAAAARTNLGLATVAATGLDTDLAGAAWTTYTPTVGATSGTITSSTSSGRYKRIGKTVFFMVRITVVANGTGASAVTFSLPFTAAGQTSSPSDRWPIYGREDGAQGWALQGRIPAGTATGTISKYDNLYPAADGYALFVSGTYEAQ